MQCEEVSMQAARNGNGRTALRSCQAYVTPLHAIKCVVTCICVVKLVHSGQLWLPGITCLEVPPVV